MGVDSGGAGSDRAINIAMLASVLLAAGVLSISSYPVVDLWWQLAAGRLIAHGQGIPHHDIFSHTAPGAPWIVHEWLPCLGMYLLQGKCGLLAIAAAKSVIAVAITYLIYRGVRLRCGNWAIAGGLALWGIAAMRAYLGPRPLMLTLLFSALLLNLGDGFPRWRWGLPLLFVLWANSHLGFLFGLILLAAVAIDEIIHRRPGCRQWIALWPACAVATLANPYGFHPHHTALRILMNHTAMTNVSEWLAPDLAATYNLPFLALVPCAVIFCGYAGWRRRPAETLLLAVLVYASFRHMRNIALFSLLAPLTIAESVTHLGIRLKARPTLVLGSALALLAAVLIGSTIGGLSQTTIDEAAIGPSYFPSKAVAFLRASERGGHLYNEYKWGGYCLYELYPRYRVCMDGRAEVYFDGALDDYFAIHHGRSNWRALMARYDVETALVDRESIVYHLLRNDKAWRIVHEDRLAAVFVRVERDRTPNVSGNRYRRDEGHHRARG